VGTALGRGTVERVVVEDARFLARLAGDRDRQGGPERT
jgi:hypothetical protein